MMEKIIRPFYHDHPLIFKENVSKEESVDCYGCGYPIGYLEMAYVCMEYPCSSRNTRIILHKKCGELPSEIRHPKHLNHVIRLFDLHVFDCFLECNACGRDFKEELCYACYDCGIIFDITCEKLEERTELQHPSHPDHPLTLMRKPAFPFKCDGCGAEDVDMAYICSACEFWVHKKCALLPTILPINHQYHHHHHPLSLAYSIPRKHDNQYHYKCDVCDDFLIKTSWVYYCDDCRYFVHIKCVGTTTNSDSNLIEDDEDGEDVIQFPLNANDISNQLITPFVMREKGVDNIPNTTSSLFLPNYHDHPLTLSLSLVTQEADNDEEELIKICDVCVTPISSSSSSPYYHCPTSSCNYFIHSICSLLPDTLQYSSSPNLVQLYGDCPKIPNKNHNFTLYKSSDKHGISCWVCNLCHLTTNGMGYKCEACGMRIDIKCASLPTAIRHSSHLRRHHKPLVLTRKVSPQVEDKGRMMNRCCHVCSEEFRIAAAYCCSEEGCDFGMDFECLQLPMSVIDREWDSKHPLLLMFDASLDHPSGFICEVCEVEIFPKMGMYHCRQCDLSFHLYCLRNDASGRYRNIKFGRRFELNGIHPNHPLTFSYITLKRRCDLCEEFVYSCTGFECADCYYVVCDKCGIAEMEKI